MSTGTRLTAVLPAFVMTGLVFAAAALAGESLTDAQIRQLIIEESTGSYPGNCPCPWNTDRRGRRCGGRSAYNRGGGYAPVCFPHDISDEQVKAFREARKL